MMACGKNSNNNEQVLKGSYESGLQFEYFVKNEGDKHNLGDIIEFDMIEYQDSIEKVNTFKIPGYCGRALLKQPSFSGDIMEGLLESQIGDSVLFEVDGALIPSYKNVNKVQFIIKVRSIWNEDSLVKNMTQTLAKAGKKQSLITQSGMGLLIDEKSKGRKYDIGDTVSIRYKALYTNGVPFESNADEKEPLTFVLGEGKVFPIAFEEAAFQLNYGDKITIIAPHYLAYGDRDLPPVLKYSTIVFEVDFLPEN